MTEPAPRIMGIVNVTPDSFSDGGEFLDAERAIAHGRSMLEEGAEILDVGGESTRPGAAAVDAEEESRRVIPVVEGLVAVGATVSIDTSKARVAARALDAGARIVNDVTALGDGEMAPLVADRGCELVLMHMQGIAADDAGEPQLRGRGRRCAGVPRRATGAGGRGGNRRAADLGRSRDRVRQDRRAQPRADPASR